jgi:hypothetical protein
MYVHASPFFEGSDSDRGPASIHEDLQMVAVASPVHARAATGWAALLLLAAGALYAGRLLLPLLDGATTHPWPFPPGGKGGAACAAGARASRLGPVVGFLFEGVGRFGGLAPWASPQRRPQSTVVTRSTLSALLSASGRG